MVGVAHARALGSLWSTRAIAAGVVAGPPWFLVYTRMCVMPVLIWLATLSVLMPRVNTPELAPSADWPLEPAVPVAAVPR